MPTKSSKFNPGSRKFNHLPCVSAVKYKTLHAVHQKKWITSGLRSDCIGIYMSRLALFTEPQLLGRRDGRGWGGLRVNWLGVQRHLSTQIHSKLFCGAVIGSTSWASQPSSVPRLNFCKALQKVFHLCHDLKPQPSSPKLSCTTVCWTDAQFQLNNEVCHYAEKSPCYPWLTVTQQ